jgi:hypothetical protein
MHSQELYDFRVIFDNENVRAVPIRRKRAHSTVTPVSGQSLFFFILSSTGNGITISIAEKYHATITAEK